jgi:hypothetical protein
MRRGASAALRLRPGRAGAARRAAGVRAAGIAGRARGVVAGHAQEVRQLRHAFPAQLERELEERADSEQEVLQVGQPAAVFRGPGLVGVVVGHVGDHFPAATDGGDDGLDLASAALAQDGLEHAPDVGVGLEVLLAVAELVDAFDQAPVDESAQVHAGVAARDVQAGHDVVGTERLVGDEQEGVNLGHGAVDAPVTAHLSPAADEQGFGLIEGGGHGSVRRSFRIYRNIARPPGPGNGDQHTRYAPSIAAAMRRTGPRRDWRRSAAAGGQARVRHHADARTSTRRQAGNSAHPPARRRYAPDRRAGILCRKKPGQQERAT